MIISRMVNSLRNTANPVTLTLPQLIEQMNLTSTSTSGAQVTDETSKNVATAYRCIDIISNDFAKLPEQVFINRAPGKIDRMQPTSRPRNAAYLLEHKPNRYMTPFKFKRLRMAWLLTFGASYVWQPVLQPGQRRELFILPSDRTWPYMDQNGELYYQTTFMDGTMAYLPSVEVMSLIINSKDGITGRGIISYARDTLGRRMGASETQASLYRHGLNPGGIMWMAGSVTDPKARDKVRNEYESAMSGSGNAFRLAVLDNKVAKFEQITMKPVDVEFLAGIEQNDIEIANFFNMPLYKLNMGKQAYNSNDQQNLEYLSSCLDAYLVQAEEVDAEGLLSEAEQENTYLRFNRDALLRTDAKTRAEVIDKRIQSGVLTPNEGRQIDDLSSYEGGDSHYIPGNTGQILADGSIKIGAGAQIGTTPGGK